MSEQPPDFKAPANCFNCSFSIQTKLSPFTVKCSKYDNAYSSSSQIRICNDWTPNPVGAWCKDQNYKDELEYDPRRSMALMQYNIRSNQKHQHLREKFILESLSLKFHAIIEQLPNLDKDKVKEDLTILEAKFKEASKELRDTEATQLKNITKYLEVNNIP
jgi:hypothetical protein